jgi:formylglycine-generating enzyme required for sulfatase activity
MKRSNCNWISWRLKSWIAAFFLTLQIGLSPSCRANQILEIGTDEFYAQLSEGLKLVETFYYYMVSDTPLEDCPDIFWILFDDKGRESTKKKELKLAWEFVRQNSWLFMGSPNEGRPPKDFFKRAGKEYIVLPPPLLDNLKEVRRFQIKVSGGRIGPGYTGYSHQVEFPIMFCERRNRNTIDLDTIYVNGFRIHVTTFSDYPWYRPFERDFDWIDMLGFKKPESFETEREYLEQIAVTPMKSDLLSDPEPQKVVSFDLGAGVDLKMVHIPGGSFEMGSPVNERGRYDIEGPVRTVDLDGFWIGKYPITRSQYQAIMGTKPSSKDHPDSPVASVSWFDAMEFCRKLSEKTGQTFRLPSEAQWEYACRAGTRTRFFFGDDETMLKDYALYKANYRISKYAEEENIHAIDQKTWYTVDQRKPNAWGLHDMIGNVFEWCLDRYGRYKPSPERNPVSTGSGALRVRRGGAWSSHAAICRSAYRGFDPPETKISDIGFRVVAQ